MIIESQPTKFQTLIKHAKVLTIYTLILAVAGLYLWGNMNQKARTMEKEASAKQIQELSERLKAQSN